ncbi:MAG: PH domain-containing protein [Treponema sp.]|nr:PH domain-containing protein [Treponema sp.]
MELIKKKNRRRGEVLIYKPEPHWIVLVRPFLILMISFVLWLFFFIAQLFDIEADIVKYLKIILIIVFVANVIFVGLYFVWQLLDYSSVKYYITNKRLMLRRGFFSSVTVDIPIERVEGLICFQGLLGKQLDYGTVLVSGIGGMSPRFSAVKKPDRVVRIIDDILEKNKQITVVHNNKHKSVTVKNERKIVEDIEYGTYIASYPVGRD